jgi:hypothetical protein
MICFSLRFSVKQLLRYCLVAVTNATTISGRVTSFTQVLVRRQMVQQ